MKTEMEVTSSRSAELCAEGESAWYWLFLDIMGRSVTTELSLDSVLFSRQNVAQLALRRVESASEIRPTIPNGPWPRREIPIGASDMSWPSDRCPRLRRKGEASDDPSVRSRNAASPRMRLAVL